MKNLQTYEGDEGNDDVSMMPTQMQARHFAKEPSVRNETDSCMEN